MADTPEELAARLGSPDDVQDFLHQPYTAALHALVAMGPRALPALAPLLKAPDALTRERAIVAIRDIASRITDGDALWRTLQGYDPSAPQDERDRAADRWSEWIAKQ
ncbi:MAG TPA: hypothetical protein VHP37_19675 [Burkholderiales bacterium]|nr:hypothetical protein [Burkholderiales bacterium]